MHALPRAEQCAEAAAAGGSAVPKSRRLCAVPFVGKDVPSAASEFSHPDVVIGMTVRAIFTIFTFFKIRTLFTLFTRFTLAHQVCAYRHEGMRTPDFKKAMQVSRSGADAGLCARL
jgi:hypothetical protein